MNDFDYDFITAFNGLVRNNISLTYVSLLQLVLDNH